MDDYITFPRSKIKIRKKFVRSPITTIKNSDKGYNRTKDKQALDKELEKDLAALKSGVHDTEVNDDDEDPTFI
jgi:hypothetical protein